MDLPTANKPLRDLKNLVETALENSFPYALVTR